MQTQTAASIPAPTPAAPVIPLSSKRTSDKPAPAKRDRTPGPKVYENQRGSGWIIRYRYTDPRTGRKEEIKRVAQATTITAARAEARALEREVLDTIHRDPAARGLAPTVTDFLEDFVSYLAAHEKSPATIRNYRQHWLTYIAPQIGDVRLSDLTPAHFQKVLAECERRKMSANTKRQVVATLNRGLSVAQLLDKARNLPRCGQIKRPAMNVQAHAPEEAKALIDACETQRDQVMIALGLFGGLRRGEVVAVRGEDFTEGEGGQLVLTIRRAAWGTIVKSTKSGRERCVTLGKAASAAVRSHLATLDDRHGWLFPGGKGREHTCVESSAYMRCVRRICKTAGVAFKGTHKLRKTAATALARAGLGAWQIAAFLGHADIAIAQRYVDRARAQDPQAAAAVDRYMLGAEGSAAG